MGFYEQFTSLFGKNQKARIETLEGQVRTRDARIIALDSEAIKKDNSISELQEATATFLTNLHIALGDAAPAEPSDGGLLSGVTSLRSQVDTLTAELAPFQEYIDAHAESSHDSASPDESPQGEVGEEGQEEEVDQLRDSQGRFMSADEADTE